MNDKTILELEEKRNKLLKEVKQIDEILENETCKKIYWFICCLADRIEATMKHEILCCCAMSVVCAVLCLLSCCVCLLCIVVRMLCMLCMYIYYIICVCVLLCILCLIFIIILCEYI